MKTTSQDISLNGFEKGLPNGFEEGHWVDSPLMPNVSNFPPSSPSSPPSPSPPNLRICRSTHLAPSSAMPTDLINTKAAPKERAENNAEWP